MEMDYKYVYHHIGSSIHIGRHYSDGRVCVFDIPFPGPAVDILDVYSSDNDTTAKSFNTIIYSMSKVETFSVGSCDFAHIILSCWGLSIQELL